MRCPDVIVLYLRCPDKKKERDCSSLKMVYVHDPIIVKKERQNKPVDKYGYRYILSITIVYVHPFMPHTIRSMMQLTSLCTAP